MDDDPHVLAQVTRFLASQGLRVVHTDNGSEALLLARESRPDVMLIDAEMPGLDGHAVCRVIKREPDTRNMPIVIMSGSRIAEHEVLSGFEGGADDYVMKPFSLPILLARLQAVMRRYDGSVIAGAVLRKAGIALDPGARTVSVHGRIVPLTRKEFDLLAILLSKSGRVLPTPYLLETVWGYDPADYNDPATVEVHVSHLRKKLGPAIGKRIVNVHGRGYKLED